MTQFVVHRNTDPATRKSVPFLLDIQSDLIADLATRVVVPLYPQAAMRGLSMQTLTPSCIIDGQEFLLLTPQLAGVSRKALGEAVADLSPRRSEILAAIDLIVSGI